MGCYNDKLLFIHIPKTGGRSCKTYLKQNVPGMLMPDDPEAKLPIGHVRLADVERFTGRKPESFEKIIAVIRNPYEQQLSQWMFWRDRFARGQRHIHDQVAASYGDLTGFLQDPRCDFHSWYMQHYGYEPGMTPAEQRQVRETEVPNPDGANRYEDFGGIYLFWLSVDGKIPDNVRTIRFEELDVALPEAVQDFIPADNCRAINLPRLNRSPPRGDVRDYYTPLAAGLVEQKCQWAFQLYEPWKYSDFTN